MQRSINAGKEGSHDVFPGTRRTSSSLVDVVGLVTVLDCITLHIEGIKHSLFSIFQWSIKERFSYSAKF